MCGPFACGGGTVGAGEAYINDLWRCDDLTALVRICSTVAIGIPFLAPLYMTAMSRFAVVLMNPHSANPLRPFSSAL